jgi:DNA (cytosine-5)-methyltransferase 1
MKVLNLYAGIGGNRKLWENVEVTAVELNPEIASIYQKHFPQDKVEVTDAHKFLEEHYDDGWDFIWASPPCPTHSRIRNIAGVGCGNVKPVYPDMKLYEEIIFLNQIYYSSGPSFKGKFCVENVRSYYEPLIKPYEVGMHYFWSNFYIPPFDILTRGHFEDLQTLQKIKGFEVTSELMLKNCVEPELGLHIFKSAWKDVQQILC